MTCEAPANCGINGIVGPVNYGGLENTRENAMWPFGLKTG
jgi:hypothetical protein